MMLVSASVLQPLIDAADAILVFLHDRVGFGWGMSIVGMTVIVRLAILPLTLKQVKSMNALRALQPQIKEIQEKYKGDRQRMNQAMMRFYQENKVNPLGSCLPLLLQIPVFISLFSLLRGSKFSDRLTPGSAGWLFIENLAKKATSGALIALVVLYVVSQLGASLVMSVAVDRTQQRIMFLFPLIFVPVILRFPAGLIVYWITTNIWTIGQQVVVRRIAPPVQIAPTAAVVGDNPAKPPPPPRKKKRRRR